MAPVGVRAHRGAMSGSKLDIRKEKMNRGTLGTFGVLALLVLTVTLGVLGRPAPPTEPTPAHLICLYEDGYAYVLAEDDCAPQGLVDVERLPQPGHS
jgi:hypothetical protein